MVAWAVLAAFTFGLVAVFVGYWLLGGLVQARC
jgi:hypothetical protein